MWVWELVDEVGTYCLEVSYAVGVDGLTYLPSLPLLLLLDGFQPYYCNKYSLLRYSM